MARETAAQLREHIEKLEAENAALKDEVVPEVKAPGRRRSWAWTLLATVLIVIGSILAPIAVIGSWVNVSLTDTDRFVATYAPLSEDPQVQAFVAQQVVAAINEQTDVATITDSVIDGIIELGTGPVATRALEALKGPASAGVQSLIESGVDNFVASDAFSAVWAQSLRLSHTELIAAMTGNTQGAVVISGGDIGIQLGPIVEQVKTALVAQGLTFAAAIPTVNRTIVLAHSDVLPTIQLAYQLATNGGYWLPLIALLFLVAGVLVARRRSVALIWAAVALALVMGLTLAAFETGHLVFLSTVAPAIPMGVAGTLFAAVAGAMQDTAVAVLVLAVVVAVVGWVAGPFTTPRKLRSLAQSWAASVRAAAEKRGLTTGHAGEWMYRQRLLLRVAVAVVAAAVVLFVRPLTPGLILWTLVLAAVVLWLLELAQRPANSAGLAE